MTRAVSIRLALQTAILAALPLAALASDMGTSVPGYEAKLSFCQDCHGVEGQGFLGWYTIPRLANQQPEYILNQLKAFVTKNRENNIAIPMYRVHNAAPELGRALAAHFNKLNPPPAGGAPAGLAEKGKKIFEGGDSDNNIPACIVCHGPQGQGAGKNPSLAGQRYPYVVNELRNWRTKRDQRYETETVATMAPIAASLSKAETEAVAAYVNSIWLRHGRYEAEAKSQPSCFPCTPPLPAEEAVVIGERLFTRNCTMCHGTSAQGFATAPRLAGQQFAYLGSQLQSFHDHRRNNPLSQLYMWRAAGPLVPGTAAELATFLSSVEPKPACDGDEQLVEAGRKLYSEGNPEENIVPCVACHGPDAQGIRDIPRLAGLSYYYLKRRLVQWAEGFDPDAKPPMPSVAGKLSAPQIEALASYLSFAQ